MKRLKESKAEMIHTFCIQGLREMHSIFGKDLFSENDKTYLDEMKINGATKSYRDILENLINELEGRRYLLTFI